MFYLKYGDIVPGEGVGLLKLGMNYEQLTNAVGEFQVKDLEDFTIILAGDVQIWVDKKKDQATQILVNNGFTGKYAGLIGLGSSINDVKRLLNKNFYEELDVYYIEGVPGMCFDLDDSNDDDWDELNAPIEYIAVFR